MRILRPVVVLGVLALVAGCGGRLQSVTPPLSETPAAGTTGKLTFTLVVPKKVNPKTKSYVSPGSKGLYMVFDIGSQSIIQTFKLEKGAKGCAPKRNNLSCKITVSLAPGKYASTMYVYDQAPTGTGSTGFPPGAKVLSGNCCEQIQYTIKSGKTKTIRPVLYGFIGSAMISNFPQGCITGSFSAQAFTVAAYDDDGYTIAGTYDQQINLSDSDTSGNTTLKVTGPDNPPPDQLRSSFDTPTIAWNGQPLAGGGATISAETGHQPLASATLWAGPGDVVFNYTGSSQYQTVSPCANSSVTVWAWGAQGGSAIVGNSQFSGGYGGLVVATVPVTTGQQLTVVVGGAGGNGLLGQGNPSGSCGSSGGGGYNGGACSSPVTVTGDCGPPQSNPYYPCYFAGGGGGATDVRQGGSSLTNRIIVAGGGGGTSADEGLSAFPGGGGGGSTGGVGAPGDNTITGSEGGCQEFQNLILGGGGGTQSSGGKGGGEYYGYQYKNDGSSGSGGPGELFCDIGGIFLSGGGGGGWFGGGGGAESGAGGGGSGYAEPSATNVLMDSGFTAGPGLAEICWPQPTNCKVTLNPRPGKIIKRPRIINHRP